MNDQPRRVVEALPPPPATFHFIGIGGIGMSALARILTMWGHKVTGSDAAESANVEALRALGIPVTIGHDDPTFASLADIDPTKQGAYRDAITALGENRAVELLHDLRNTGRNPRRYRHGADGKPRYRAGRTVSDHHHRE